MTTELLDSLELLSEIACGSAAGVLVSLAVFGWADWLYETLRRGDLVGASRECQGRAGPAASQAPTQGSGPGG